VTDEVLGNIEFGVSAFGIPLIIVLGHESCGAASAAINAHQIGAAAPPGKTGLLVQAMLPAVQRGYALTGDLVDNVIAENIRYGIEVIRKTSPVLAPLFDSGKVEVIGMKYNLSTGIVDLFD
jgi:carbonic anhydrase